MIARYEIGAYFAGATCARLGEEMSGPALLLFGIMTTGSTATGSLVYAAVTVAAGVGGPLFGAVLDRSRRPGRVLAIAVLGYAAGLGAVAAALSRAPTAVTVGVAVTAGLLAPALSGGWTSQLSGLLSPEDLSRGHALDAGTYNLAGLAGPALAAGVAGGWGAGCAVLGAVLVLLLAIPAAWTLPGNWSAVARRPALAADLRDGFRALLRTPGLRRITIASCLGYLGFGVFVVSCPSLGRIHFGSDGLGALLLTVVAGAALLATTALYRWPTRQSAERTFLASTALAVVGLLLAAFAPGPVLLIAGVAVLGLADGPQLAAIFALRQRDAPARLRAQIFTTAASLKVSAGAVGAGVGGAVVSRSATAGLVIASMMQAIALLYFALATRRPAGRRFLLR